MKQVNISKTHNKYFHKTTTQQTIIKNNLFSEILYNKNFNEKNKKLWLLTKKACK